MEHSRASGISHITVTATLFVAALLCIGVWEIVHMIDGQKNPVALAGTGDSNAATHAASSSSAGTSAASADPIASVSSTAVNELLSAYEGLQQGGAYSTSSATAIAGSIGQSLQAPVTYQTWSASDVETSPDTSYAAMMNYRAALQVSLKPLISNTEPEYELFGLYVQTKQTTYLDQLRTAAANYLAAASSTAQIVVPADAVSVQLGLLNSMNEFAAVLDAMASHAQDPIASTVLLENYNQAESDVLSAFQALVTYEKSKVH